MTDDELREVTRRRFLQAVGGLGLAGGVLFLVARGIAYRPAAPEAGRAGRSVAAPGARPAAEDGTDSLDELARSIRHGAPGKDSIPAIDHPRFVPAARAGFLADEDVVFGLVRDGQARAYPQLVLVWHEIVNDRFPSGPLSITYCPLTGSAVAYHGTAPGGEPYTFGTSGDLVNSNLLMYDRQTDSRWPQLLGEAILGPSRGRLLEGVPLDWTSWGLAGGVEERVAGLDLERRPGRRGGAVVGDVAGQAGPGQARPRPSGRAGGYRHHRRIAELAPAGGATGRFVCLPDCGCRKPVGAGKSVVGAELPVRQTGCQARRPSARRNAALYRVASSRVRRDQRTAPP